MRGNVLSTALLRQSPTRLATKSPFRTFARVTNNARLERPLVPTIDIDPFLKNPTSEASEAVVTSIRDACRKTGFFAIVGHGLSRSLQQGLIDGSTKFFSLDAKEKLKLDAKSQIGRRGYDVLASQSYHAENLPDLKEGFYVGHDVPIDDPKVKARRFFMGPNVWPAPAVLPEQDFRQPVEAYFEAIHNLALKVLAIIERSLPYGPGIFDEFTKGHTVAVLRCLHYPPVKAEDSEGGKKQLGAGAHTDFGAITLLLQDENAGLEVLNPDTEDFVAVEPSPDAFVFNVGDMLSFWTGGEYKSSVHRVINKAPRDRYSAAFFYDGALDCPLTPLNKKGAELSEGEHTLTVEKHMIKRITESYGPAQKG
ncbi:putative 2OG-Fe(II) oxygenase family oxidoreductase [Myriangium duriaei CBS 260.36]|uniref:2OG-Fe(II) oxygenase family oxidoreductase n=1 Tax=Myriangium duriaei CBS 260.36 TaxID=1168546 RepID=A0A9P4IZH7_9PEZI|nr:putative 2OG-Fe(II) oxygenase family oxidoreductase [Myriangium duriaei CBS 260.36]